MDSFERAVRLTIKLHSEGRLTDENFISSIYVLAGQDDKTVNLDGVLRRGRHEEDSGVYLGGPP